MQKNTRSNRDYLYSVFLEAKSIPNRTILNDIVYISQEAGIIESNYPFRRSSSNVADPISSDLLVDLNYLEENNVIKDTDRADSLVLIDQKYGKGNLISKSNKKELSYILNLSKEDLRTLGEIICLKENYLKQGLTRKEIVKNISYCIDVSKANVSRGLKYFNNIKK